MTPCTEPALSLETTLRATFCDLGPRGEKPTKVMRRSTLAGAIDFLLPFLTDLLMNRCCCRKRMLHPAGKKMVGSLFCEPHNRTLWRKNPLRALWKRWLISRVIRPLWKKAGLHLFQQASRYASCEERELLAHQPDAPHVAWREDAYLARSMRVHGPPAHPHTWYSHVRELGG